MSELKGTKTEKNLMEAFAGESMARNKYTYFASAARKDGYEQIAAIFEETALNEKEHAKLHFKLLEGIGDTPSNLQAAAGGENEEHTSMYPRMAAEAREEGFEQIAKHFEYVAKIEAEHEARYRKLLEEVKAGTFFQKNAPKQWHCRNCGHIHEGEKAPKVCPVCKHPQAFFELRAENF